MRSDATVKPLVIACIPAFNEERSIGRAVLVAQRYVARVVVCDDGSSDLTGEIAERLGASVLRHAQNRGKGAALHTLFQAGHEWGADVLVTLDGDGQHDPADIPAVVRPIVAGEADVVVGSRFLRASGGVPRARALGNRLLTGLTRAVGGGHFTDSQSGFRAYSARALERLEVRETGMDVDSALLVQAVKQGLRIAEVPVGVRYAGLETSTLHPVPHLYRVAASLVRLIAERKPLWFFVAPGLGMIGVGLWLGYRVVEIFLATQLIATGSAILAVGLIIVGFLSAVAGVILHVLAVGRGAR